MTTASDKYTNLTDGQIVQRINEIKSKRGNSLLMLGHHYQRDDVIGFSDLQGDSFLLARQAADSTASDIVFLGVHFMAETADILTDADQRVFMPDTDAGCEMADMANVVDVSTCWDRIVRRWGDSVIPVTYVNSTAAIKDFCGRHGGLTCTSSSAFEAFSFALEEGERLLFLPDWCLGTNTAKRMGIGSDEIAIYDRCKDQFHGSGDPKVILWDGFCPVHQDFGVEDILQFRRAHPNGRVVVHPECKPEAVSKADCSGSTEFIRSAVSDAGPDTVWAVGTETNLVHRLDQQYSDRKVNVLGSTAGPCEDMMKITRKKLLHLLEQMENKTADEFRISVAPQVAEGARLALERMLDLSS